MKEHKIVFIIPWIGKLPSYFPIWLESCRKNPTVNFLIFTDDYAKYNYPDNVTVYYVTFDELRKLFQSKFDFPIVLNRPYKFCDYKPAYGEVFADYIKEYDFWGHCDIDIIWGDIRKFITEDIMKNYKRIYSHGHCCLYKNIPEVNSWYRTLPSNGFQNWKDVFQNPKSCCFDEWGQYWGGGLSYIVESNNIAVYDSPDYADISDQRGYFFMRRKKELHPFKSLYFCFDNGHLYVCNKDKIIEELLYVHFQKRNITVDKVINNPIYFVAPNIITSDFAKTKKNNFWAKKTHEIRHYCKRIENTLNRILN